MKISQNLLIAAVGLIALALGGVFYHQQEVKVYSNQIQVYQPTRSIQPFELHDQLGKPFTKQELDGKWSLVFLGYLSCPDICPMTMAKLSRLIPKLQEVASQPVQVLFVSVDPLRDSAEKRAQYVNYFNPDIVGLGAEHPQLFPFVRNLGLMYSVPEQGVTEGYFVDHSASVVLINPQAEINAIFKPEVELNQVPTVNTDTVLSDFTTLID